VIAFLISAYLITDKELRIKRGLQRDLEDQIRFIRAVLDNSVDLILVLDIRSNLLVANKKSIDLLGITDAMIGQNIFSLFPMGKDSKTHHGILRALKGEYVHIVKHKARSIDLTLESFFIPLRQGNYITAVIIIHHDISELAKASEELEAKNEQLGKSNLELEQFAYVASHDLQEPLRKVIAYSGFAEKAKGDPEKLSGYLLKISNSAERMSHLIRDILHLSRAGAATSEIESVNLADIYRQVILDLELLIAEKRATIHADLLPSVAGRTQQLSQVFYNLINNALKFCDKEPVITIRCRTENEYYVISVGDNGIGFDPLYKDQIFEVFKRIPNKKEYSGNGIGLAVCKKIINNHRGTITVESKIGTGTTFEIRLPIPPLHTANTAAEKYSGQV
jgi:two-component system CheB/CheR fusion protein